MSELKATFYGWFLHYKGMISHKAMVLWYILCFCGKLVARAVVHDNSKFKHAEAIGFATVIPQLSKVVYGSAEYKHYLTLIKPSIDLHYKNNAHHPQHYLNEVNDMKLVDVIEMIADWKSSVKRQKDGSIERSFEINKERFKMSDELVRLLKTI